MRKKIVLFIGISFICFRSISQTIIDTTCSTLLDMFPKKGCPECAHVDTLDAATFQMVLDTVYGQMKQHISMSKPMDNAMVMVVNTVYWGEYDKQDSLLSKFPKAKLITELFKKMYEHSLFCKYNVFYTKGGYPYIEDLQIYYDGDNPRRHSRFKLK